MPEIYRKFAVVPQRPRSKQFYPNAPERVFLTRKDVKRVELETVAHVEAGQR